LTLEILVALAKLFSSRARQAARVVENGYDLFDDPELPAAVTEVQNGRFETARQLLASASSAELRSARLRRFAEAAIPHLPALTALCKKEPGDADLAMWLGTTHVEHGWEVRGDLLAKYTDQSKFEEFWLILGRAHESLTRAASLRPSDVVALDRLQWHGLGSQRPREELDDIWAELAKRDPYFYDGHASRIQVLCEKWQGSNEEVAEFARASAVEAPVGSPIPALLVAMGLELATATRTSFFTYFQDEAVQTELARYADAWCANPAPSIRTAEAHHLFGAAFFLSGDLLRARRHLSRVHPLSIPRNLPWVRLADNPGALYLRVRKEAGVEDGVVFDPGPLPLVPR
jgi:hypothetical protein